MTTHRPALAPLAFIALAAALAGCSAEPTVEGAPTSEFERLVINKGEAACTPLIAGQSIEAGSVCITTDGEEYVTVTYTTTGGWELTEAHLWAGLSLADAPVTKKGNPIPGAYPYNSGDITGATSWSFQLSIAEVFGIEDTDTCADTTAYFAAHAAVRKADGSGGYQTETGWGKGKTFVDRGNWGMWFTMGLSCVKDEEPPPPPKLVDCETMFAYDEKTGTCFLDLELDDVEGADFNRWGWTNGPDESGSRTYTLYAGAGQCDITKGTKVGTATMTWDAKTGEVKFVYQTEGGVVMDETHLYVGADVLPRDPNGEYTVAPGQYPYIHEDPTSPNEDAYFLTSETTPLHVVAHGVACCADDPEDGIEPRLENLCGS